ncbi:hypothetical protein, partial [Streptococcus pneumoniae]|uniref:hypothetical protein n=1 Tax=Streptococcus pneumoniae TaxID=1313 RepID=UPI001E34ADE5
MEWWRYEKSRSAFPQFDVISGERDGHGDAIDAYTTATGGMTLRDWVAGQVVPALVAKHRADVRWSEVGPLAYE